MWHYFSSAKALAKPTELTLATEVDRRPSRHVAWLWDVRRSNPSHFTFVPVPLVWTLLDYCIVTMRFDDCGAWPGLRTRDHAAEQALFTSGLCLVGLSFDHSLMSTCESRAEFSTLCGLSDLIQTRGRTLTIALSSDVGFVLLFV
jgi:hypothetical protein